MASKTISISENISISEASEFWDTHSVSDCHSHIVQLEYAPEEEITFVAIADNLLNKVGQQAKEHGVSMETLINLWIQEKVGIAA
ncbi:MAG: CopG family antitoxin [Candidatus Desantisbacteria bacterium]